MMPSGHKAFLVHNPKDVELLLMHNRTYAAEYVALLSRECEWHLLSSIPGMRTCALSLRDRSPLPSIYQPEKLELTTVSLGSPPLSPPASVLRSSLRPRLWTSRSPTPRAVSRSSLKCVVVCIYGHNENQDCG
jgi:hypothetical protein